MASDIFIGIDGGGTQCRARLRDASGRVCGEGRGGPANIRFDPPQVMEALLLAARAAADDAGLADDVLVGAGVGLGLAGAAQRDCCDALLAQPHPFGRIVLDTDAYAAWRGAFGGDDGAIFILGTGSCGFAVVGGRRHTIGGYGAELSDEASGAAIGREALRRMLWAQDGRIAASPLTESLFATFGTIERVVAFATDAKPRDFARHAPAVFDHAASGDPVASAILEHAADEAARILERLAAIGATRIALLGGLAEPLRPWLTAPAGTRLVAPEADAMDGAIAMARDAAG